MTERLYIYSRDLINPVVWMNLIDILEAMFKITVVKATKNVIEVISDDDLPTVLDLNYTDMDKMRSFLKKKDYLMLNA